MAEGFDEYSELDWQDDYPCCHEACIVIYYRGVTWSNCYAGTGKTWKKTVKRFNCNDSMLIIGNLKED